jgi:hypothetical protein
MMKLFFCAADHNAERRLLLHRVKYSGEGFRSLSMKFEDVAGDAVVFFDPAGVRPVPAPAKKVDGDASSALDAVMCAGFANIVESESVQRRCESKTRVPIQHVSSTCFAVHVR